MRVAVCQLNARDDRAANLAVARTLLERSAAAGAEVAVLPEYTDYLGPADRAPKPEPVDGEYAAFFADAARELDIAVVAGSFHEVGPDAERTFNTSLVFDRDGTLASGTETVVVPIAGVPFGLSICYDLRFPELYRRLAVDGAQVLVVPAAFMLHTGRDHWEVLLRARAIENQCYVLAAAQIGDHEPGRTCFGRSMVIDPWGTVLAQAPDTVGIAVADLDFERLGKIRAELPRLANRRLSL